LFITKPDIFSRQEVIPGFESHGQKNCGGIIIKGRLGTARKQSVKNLHLANG
jgi:hypothetical protein